MDGTFWTFILATFIFISNFLCRFLSIGTPLGYLVVGILISLTPVPHLLIIKVIGHIGLLFVLFKIGLETSFQKIADLQQYLWTSIMLIVIPITGLFIFLKFAGFNSPFLLAVCLSFSSTVISSKNLYDTGKLGSKVGLLSLCLIILQDLVSILQLVVLKTRAINIEIVGKIVFGIMFFVAALFYLAPIIDTIFKRLLKIMEGSWILFFFFWVMTCSYIGNMFGLSSELGALIAGMFFADSAYNIKIESSLHSFEEILLSFFFISIGLNINFSFILGHFWEVLSVFLGLSIVKFVTFFIASYNKLKWESLWFAMNLFNLSEFCFIIVGELLRSHYIFYYEKNIIFGALFFSITFSYIIFFIVNKLTYFSKKNKNSTVETEDCSVIILGINEKTKILMQFFENMGLCYVGVDNNINKVIDARQNKFKVVYGNCFDIQFLKKVGLSTCKTIFVSIPVDEKIIDRLETIKLVNQNVKIILTVTNASGMDLCNHHGYIPVQETPSLFAREAAINIFSTIGQNKKAIDDYFDSHEV